MSGTFVSLKGSTVTLSHPGTRQPDSTHDVDAAAVITLDGKTAKLTDLQAGDRVSLGGNPATTVTATR